MNIPIETTATIAHLYSTPDLEFGDNIYTGQSTSNLEVKNDIYIEPEQQRSITNTVLACIGWFLGFSMCAGALIYEIVEMEK